MESWRQIFREGVAKALSLAGLKALAEGCRTNDPRLMQGRTTEPAPLMCVQGWPCEGACALGYAGWKGEGLNTVGEVERFFAMMCFDTDTITGEAAGVRHFLTWFDDTPRPEMLRELLAECERAIAEREAVAESR